MRILGQIHVSRAVIIVKRSLLLTQDTSLKTSDSTLVNLVFGGSIAPLRGLEIEDGLPYTILNYFMWAQNNSIRIAWYNAPGLPDPVHYGVTQTQPYEPAKRDLLQATL